jgi:YVTN family beta-propeller protein
VGAAVDPATHTVYVISEGVDTNNNGTVSVINEATNKVTAVIPVGRAPLAVAVDPVAHTVYVANDYVSGGSSGSLSVIDEATNKVTGTVLIGDNASGVAVDPVTHAAYVTSPNGGTVSVIGGGHAPANCMPELGACGYPDAASTGVPTGTTLKTVPGQASSGRGWHFDKRGFVQVNGDGAVLKDLSIPYNVDITASHVTLQDDQITPGSFIGVTLRHTSGDVIEDSTISGHPATGGVPAAGIKDIYGDSTGLQVLWDDFAGTSVAVQVNAGLIAGNYIHPPASGGSAYAAGIVSNGGNTAPLAVEHNTVLVGASYAYAIGLFADFGPQANRLIDNNLLAGGSYTRTAATAATSRSPPTGSVAPTTPRAASTARPPITPPTAPATPGTPTSGTTPSPPSPPHNHHQRRTTPPNKGRSGRGSEHRPMRPPKASTALPSAYRLGSHLLARSDTLFTDARTDRPAA